MNTICPQANQNLSQPPKREPCCLSRRRGFLIFAVAFWICQFSSSQPSLQPKTAIPYSQGEGTISQPLLIKGFAMPVSRPKNELDERSRNADKSLAQRYDQLTQLWVDAEKRLKALKVAHDVSVTYNHSEGFPDDWELLLVTKYQGQWRLCHAFDCDGQEEGPTHVQPIVECPAEIRVNAVPQLRRLHQRIVESKEEFVSKVDEAIKELAQINSEI